MKTRFLSLFLSVLMLLSLFPASAFAEEGEISGHGELPLAQTEADAAAEEEEASGEASVSAEPEAASAASETENEEAAAAEGSPEEESAPAETEDAAAASEIAAEAAADERDAVIDSAEAPELEEPEEDGAAESAEDAAEGSPTADEETVYFVEPPEQIYAPGVGEEPGDLLDQYAWMRLNSQLPSRPGSPAKAPRSSGGKLTGVNRAVYDSLKGMVAEAAAGQRSTTVFEIPVEELGLGQTSWTAAELGVNAIVENGALSQAAMAAVNALVNFDFRSVINILQADCPYELYWYDKTIGTSYSSYTFSGNSQVIRIVGSLRFTFAVALQYAAGEPETITYSDGTTADLYKELNTSYASRINAAVTDAASIVSSYAGSSDYGKLQGYMEQICSRVVYDDYAADDANEVPYGDPWQIISVFDGDSTTNVVCEGYSKAFQYLCDQTTFADDITAISVSGTMAGATGGGRHMWNLVRMEDGKNYLVDVTNCDAGSVGYPDKLFLAGFDSGSLSGGYTVLAGSNSIFYGYNSTTLSTYAESELTLSDADYQAAPPARTPGVVETREELEEDLANGLTRIIYPGSGSFVLDGSVTIPAGVSFLLPAGTLVVEQGVSLTVARDATVEANRADVRGSMTVNGILRANAASDCLAVSGSLYCGTYGKVYVGDPEYTLPEGVTVLGYFYVEVGASSEAELRLLCERAAAYGTQRFLYRILPGADISLTQDLTIPAAARVVVKSGASVVPAAGVTLSNEGVVTISQSFTAPGAIVNNNSITLAKGVTGHFAGGYAGTGYLRISPEIADPYVQVLGVPETAFVKPTPVGSDGYWNLRLRGVVDSGTCGAEGDNLTWVLYDDGELVISGEGEMADYNLNLHTLPWRAYHSEIVSACLENGVTSIGDNAFYSCYSLTAITIPGSVASIGDFAFTDCSGLTAIHVASANSAYSSLEGVLFNKDQTEIIRCPQGKSGAYTIPESVTSIGSNAFESCSGLTGITIPESVTSIGSYAFMFCSGLTAITIPSGVTSIGNATFFCCNGLTELTIPSGVTSIGDSAFYSCSGLTAITIPSGVTSIDREVFSWCTGLTELTIPSGVTSIGEMAFYHCSGLTAITIPSGVTSIGEDAFANCSGLTAITIPESVTSISNASFYCCTGLTELTIPTGVTYIGYEAFANCSGLTEITIPEGVTSISFAAFAGCSSLTEITIPDGVTSVDNYAFSSCSGLTEITVPGSVTSIGEGAFSDCTSLNAVNYGGTEEQKNARIGSGWSTVNNDPLYNAAWHCAEPLAAPEITGQPADVNAQAGSRASFTVEASGEGLQDCSTSGSTGGRRTGSGSTPRARIMTRRTSRRR